MESRRIRQIASIIVVLILFFAAWQSVLYFQHRGKIKIAVSVLPNDSKLTVDGKTSKAGSIYLVPGQHTLTASRQDFTTDTQRINTADFEKGDVVYMLPRPDSVAAKKWLAEHPEVQVQRESAGGVESVRIRRALLKKYPILASLPVENLHYKIDYSVDDNNNAKLTITLYPIINGPQDKSRYTQQLKDYKQEALDYLKKKKVNLDQFKIEYSPSAADTI